MEALNTDVRQIEIGPLESLTFKNFITHRKLYIKPTTNVDTILVELSKFDISLDRLRI